MDEKYELTQTVDDNPKRASSKGTSDRKVVKFTYTTPDDIAIELKISGNTDAMDARYGTWAFGLKPDPAKIGITLSQGGLVDPTLINKTAAQIQTIQPQTQAQPSAQAQPSTDQGSTSGIDDAIKALEEDQ